jgi:hypothetical protein
MVLMNQTDRVDQVCHGRRNGAFPRSLLCLTPRHVVSPASSKVASNYNKQADSTLAHLKRPTFSPCLHPLARASPAPRSPRPPPRSPWASSSLTPVRRRGDAVPCLVCSLSRRADSADKSVRDRAVQSLVAFLSRGGDAEGSSSGYVRLEESEMSKLWKGLFYCERSEAEPPADRTELIGLIRLLDVGQAAGAASARDGSGGAATANPPQRGG